MGSGSVRATGRKVSKPEVRQPPGAGDDVSARGASPTTRRFQAEQLVSVGGNFAATSVKEGLARRSQTQREQSPRRQDPESVRRQGLRVHAPGAFFLRRPLCLWTTKKGARCFHRTPLRRQIVGSASRLVRESCYQCGFASVKQKLEISAQSAAKSDLFVRSAGMARL